MIQKVPASYADALMLMQRKDFGSALCALHTVASASEIPVSLRANAWATAGVVYEEMGKGEQALSAYRQAAALHPQCHAALNNLGAAATGSHEAYEAASYFRSSLALDPSHGNSIAGLAAALIQMGRFHDALTVSNEAVQREPGCVPAHWNRSIAALGCGRWKLGWAEHEWRFKLPNKRIAAMPNTPRWDGQPLDGKTIFVLAEQGFGDMLMWARCFATLRNMGARVVAEAHGPMAKLFEWMPEVDRVAAYGQNPGLHDVHVFAVSLPHILGLKLEELSGKPYITVPPRYVLPLNTGKPQVGVIWRGRLEHGNDHNRSMPPHAAEALMRSRDAEWVSLQVDHTAPWTTVHDMRDQIKNFADTAAIMRGLDLVVSVDSAGAHLAGALGVPVWTLLFEPAEWRWSYGTTTTPWYNSMELVRQPSPGDWMGVVEQVHAKLGEIRRRLN